MRAPDLILFVGFQSIGVDALSEEALLEVRLLTSDLER